MRPTLAQVLALLLIGGAPAASPPTAPSAPPKGDSIDRLADEYLDAYEEDGLGPGSGVPDFVLEALKGTSKPVVKVPTLLELQQEIGPKIAAGRHGEVEPRLKQALELASQRWGADSPELGAYRNLLSDFLDRRGRHSEAEALQLASLAPYDTAAKQYFKVAPLLDLASHYRRAGRINKSRTTIAKARVCLGDAPAERALRWGARLDAQDAELALAAGDTRNALALATRALADDTRSGAPAIELFAIELLLTTIELRAGRPSGGRQRLRAAKARVPPGLTTPGGILVTLVEADVLTAEAKPQAALDLLSKCMLLVGMVDPWGAGWAQYSLARGRALKALRRYREAEGAFRDAMSLAQSAALLRAPVLEDLLDCLQATGNRAEARKVKGELASARTGTP